MSAGSQTGCTFRSAPCLYIQAYVYMCAYCLHTCIMRSYYKQTVSNLTLCVHVWEGYACACLGHMCVCMWEGCVCVCVYMCVLVSTCPTQVCVHRYIYKGVHLTTHLHACVTSEGSTYMIQSVNWRSDLSFKLSVPLTPTYVFRFTSCLSPTERFRLLPVLHIGQFQAPKNRNPVLIVPWLY